MIRVNNLTCCYGQAVAVRGVSLEVLQGETRVILGPNGAGKTTLLKTLMGILRPMAGTVELEGTSIQGWPSHKVAGAGMALVPQGRGNFASMSVAENLEMGAFLVKDQRVVKERMERVLVMFPQLRERMNQLAGTMSGGEQQALAIARALMSAPKILLMDEPSLGLAPVLCDYIFSMIQRINAEGMTILLVEQNARRALDICSWAYVIEIGQVVAQGPPDIVRQSPMLQRVYLGWGAKGRDRG